MKITKRQLKQIIKEELLKLNENPAGGERNVDAAEIFSKDRAYTRFRTQYANAIKHSTVDMLEGQWLVTAIGRLLDAAMKGNMMSQTSALRFIEKGLEGLAAGDPAKSSSVTATDVTPTR